MNKTLQQAKRVEGVLEAPASLRQLTRIALPALFADGDTVIKPVPRCRGTESLIRFLERAGGLVTRNGAELTLHGLSSFTPQLMADPVEAADFPGAFEAFAPLLFARGGRVSGDKSLFPPRFKHALKKLDAAGFLFDITEADGKITLALTPSAPDHVTLETNSADEAVKTTLLYALLASASGESRLIETTPLPGDTETVLRKLSAPLTVFRQGEALSDIDPDTAAPDDELSRRIKKIQSRRETAADKPQKTITLRERTRLKGASFDLCGDPLLAAPFLLAGLLIGGSRVTVKGIGGAATGGLFNALRRMGAPLKTEREKERDAFECTAESTHLTGRRLSGELTASLGDALPFAALAAAYAAGQTIIRDADFHRQSSADCIQATLSNLRAMGARVGEIEDGLVIDGAREYDGCEFDSSGIPSVGMAFAVAALKNKGQSVLKNAEAVDELWPDFYGRLESLVKSD